MTPAWIAAAHAPRSIAIVGASENPEKIGGRPIKYMRQQGYEGMLYPVNPGRAEVQGLPAYPSVLDLPETPDMVIVCVPGQLALDAIRDSASRRVPLGVIIASGFAETGEAGSELQRQMLMLARDAGMRLVGPNTQGIVNFGAHVIASFATVIGEISPMDGPVAVISQSGAMSMVPYVFLRESGIGIRYAHATGNECDLTVADFALAAAHDPAIRILLLYLESLPDPATLAEAAAVAAARGMPIVVLKTGVSVRGRAAASSHTGAVATHDKVVDAFFRQHGILRVDSMQHLVRSVPLLLQHHHVRGGRLVAVSNSGASCVMAADAAERHGLQMEAFSDETRRSVEAILPAFASGANPVDLTAALLSNSGLLSQVLPTLAEHDAGDLFFVSLPMSGKGYDVPRFAQDMARFAVSTGRPVAVASPLVSTRRTFEHVGTVTFAHDEEAIAALGDVFRHHQLRDEAERLRGHAPDLCMAPASLSLSAAERSDTGFLSEADSLAVLREMGVPVVDHVLCRNGQELAEALTRLPAPWVLKACSNALPHKSEHQLVLLNVADVRQAERGYRQLVATLRCMGVSMEGILVAPMVRSRRELIVGARWDTSFGAVVMMGDGGKYVEAMPDVVTLLYPFDVQHALQQLQRLRIAPLFEGVRGDPPLPALELAEVAVRLGAWVWRHQAAVRSIDINPLMVTALGGLVAVDALVELAPC
ncbi:MAG: acetate--CoA ligase family protein [Pigmentiphaga sp.]